MKNSTFNKKTQYHVTGILRNFLVFYIYPQSLFGHRPEKNASEKCKEVRMMKLHIETQHGKAEDGFLYYKKHPYAPYHKGRNS